MTTTRRSRSLAVWCLGLVLVTASLAKAQGAGAEDVPRAVSIDSLLATYRLPDGTALKSTLVGQLSQQSVNLLQTRTGVRAHYHAQSDEVVYVLAGRGLLRMASHGEALKAKDLAAVPPTRVKPGMVLLIPRGAAHAIDVLGDDPLVVLSIFAPVFRGDDRIALQE